MLSTHYYKIEYIGNLNYKQSMITIKLMQLKNGILNIHDSILYNCI